MCIYGDNGTGKTSLYDALVWLLFGKDSQGNGEKNLHIKPLSPSGDVRDHHAITSVDGLFLVDGAAVTFRRSCRELWATRRGSDRRVFEGNLSDYYVNGVPCRKTAYDAAIREMVSEELFRMLTSVSHFAAGMKWQERRAVLFDMAGTLSDRELLAASPAFGPLLENLKDLSLPDYKASLLHRKKGLTGIREDTPARIQECRRTLVGDLEKAKQEEQTLTRKREDQQLQLLSLDQNTAPERLGLKLREAQLELDKLESRNRSHREAQRSTGRDPDLLQGELTREQAALAKCRHYLAASGQTAGRIQQEIRDCRSQWVQVNGEAFTGGKCPACGRELPFDQLRTATEAFNKSKQARLDAITAKTDDLQETLEYTAGRVRELEAEALDREERIGQLQEQLRLAREESAAVTDLPEYPQAAAALTSRIDGLRAQLQTLRADSDGARAQLRRELQETQTKLRQVQAVLAKEALRTQTEQRIAQLQAEADSAAEALEGIDKMLYLMEEFTRFKARFAESSINGRFRLATFCLFREQVNGALEERCDVVYNGVPFPGLNNGMKVNVGIDIINTLSRHYGVSVPLFVDNAEAVTRLEEGPGQVIRLIVSEGDPVLRFT